MQLSSFFILSPAGLTDGDQLFLQLGGKDTGDHCNTLQVF